MSIFDRLGKPSAKSPANLDEKRNRISELVGKLNQQAQGASAMGLEREADELMILCEELLRFSTPPDIDLLRRAGVNIDDLLPGKGGDPDSVTIVAIDASLPREVIVEMDKAVLSRFKHFHSLAYQLALRTKLKIISKRTGLSAVDRNRESRGLAESALALMKQIQDEEGANILQGILERLALHVAGTELHPMSADDPDMIAIRCPCCGQVRKCKPFDKAAPMGGIMVPGRIPYGGVLFCGECKTPCCGAMARWEPRQDKEKEMEQLKRQKRFPDNAQFVLAKCPQQGCEGTLYVIPKAVLERFKTT